MRASRLLSILILLQLRGRVTADTLAAEFEVSVRTIYRDIDALSAAGVPVYADRGPGGGFALLEGYRTRLTGLDAPQVEALFMIGMPGPAAELGLASAASQAANKLLAALPKASATGAGDGAARFHLDPVDWYHSAEPLPHLPLLARAVLDAETVRMTYESWTAKRDWVVDPLGLVLKGGAWYLVGRGYGKVRSFRVSNIESTAPIGARFERPEGFDLPRWWAESLQRFEADLRPHVAQLRTSPLGLKRIVALGAYAATAAARASTPDAEGWVAIMLPYENEDQLALALLGVGPEVAIVAPITARERLIALANTVVSAQQQHGRTSHP